MQSIEFLNNIKCAIFDLDGVIVDTAKYHYLAWKWLAAELGFEFMEKDNERLKGVSRTRSLEILLEVGGITLPDKKKAELAAKKNDLYLSYISKIDESELLRGAKEYLLALRARGVKVALGSASKNAGIILRNTRIYDLFDAIVDGNKVLKVKPDPEVFLLGAQELHIANENCVVFEDSLAGIQAAKTAYMYAVGVGKAENLPGADYYIKGLYELL